MGYLIDGLGAENRWIFCNGSSVWGSYTFLTFCNKLALWILFSFCRNLNTGNGIYLMLLLFYLSVKAYYFYVSGIFYYSNFKILEWHCLRFLYELHHFCSDTLTKIVINAVKIGAWDALFWDLGYWTQLNVNFYWFYMVETDLQRSYFDILKLHFLYDSSVYPRNKYNYCCLVMKLGFCCLF